jgi:signal transduction histidine kinase
MAHPAIPNRRRQVRRLEDLRLMNRDRELEAVRRIAEALSQHIHVDDLVQQGLKTAMEVVGADAGSVLLANPETTELKFVHVVGAKADMLKGTSFAWDQGVAGWVFKKGEGVVVRNAKEDSRHWGGVDELTGYATRDMIVLPLKRWEGEPIGVMEILNKRDGLLDDNDLAILTIISALVADQIEKSRLHEEAKLAEVARLLGDISHDVKNLLMPVICGASLLQSEIDDVFQSWADQNQTKAESSRQTCKEVIGMVHEASRRIQDRVREITDCIKGRTSPPLFLACRVENIVDNVLKTLRFLADERGIDILTQGLTVLPIIQADERRLYNAFYNLINNAIPEVPRGGTIKIRGSVDGESILIDVADTGKGMPPDIRDRLFTPRAVSTKSGGTGLGTKIVKDAVDAHGGQITVDSTIGVGTTFHIRLPIIQPQKQTNRSSH